MIVSLTALEMILQSEDLEGLHALGAPKGEYSEEASSLQVELQNLHDEEVTAVRVAASLEGVWERAFGPFSEEERRMRHSVLQTIVGRILDEYYFHLGITVTRAAGRSKSGAIGRSTPL